MRELQNIVQICKDFFGNRVDKNRILFLFELPVANSAGTYYNRFINILWEVVMKRRNLTALLSLVLAVILGLAGLLQGRFDAAPPETTTFPSASDAVQSGQELLDFTGSYTTKDDVALYIHQYGMLPGNFITKAEARKLGWDGGSVEPYAPGKCIGGDRFGNNEGLLPDAPGRSWTECDIDTLGGGGRGAKRIVFSNDGLIYYTHDHYESFELLYGEP